MVQGAVSAPGFSVPSASADEDWKVEGHDLEEGTNWRSRWRTFAHRAQAVALPQVELLATPLATGVNGDLEGQEFPRWAWARRAVDRVREQAVQAGEQAQQGLSRGLERAESVDWNDRVAGVRQGASRSLERVSTTALTVRQNLAQQVERVQTSEWTERTRQSLSGVAENASSAISPLSERLQNFEIVQNAAGGATAAAGAARGALSSAGSRVSGAAQLAASPRRLYRFLSIFLTGLLLIFISLNFLPMLLLSPHMFALFFTLGSVTIMSSFFALAGRAFARELFQPRKLPFSLAYIASLIGTLWATLIRHSYVLTAMFSLVQASSLLYFVCSYLPGGTAGLNAMGRFGRSSVRTLLAS
mmetsp:Transcript_29343/g.77547  ORF Transcript_29343/g.77547 Transcript_29343/m.77547 type:complete len:359 (-) Transcript_29343:103-1179(-)